MRFESIAINGIGPFRRHVSIDLASIPGLLVAVTGGNGQGKSTLLECLGGALYRTTPTRGALGDLAVDRYGYVEAHVVNGKSWRIRHTLDAVSGKGESTVKDDDGNMAFASAKVRDFDAWAAKHLPTPEVLYSSTFAPQGSGGFLELKAGERKAVLLRVLGIEALEGKAERAREKARAAKQAIDVLQARIADERQRGGDVKAAEAQLDEAQKAAETTDLAVADFKSRLEQAEAGGREVERARTDHETRVRRHEELCEQQVDLLHRISELALRIANNEKVLEESEAIRAAVARAEELDKELAQLKVDESALDQRAATLKAESSAHATRTKDLERRLSDAAQRRDRATQRLSDRASIANAATELAAETVLSREDDRREKELSQELDVARGAGLDLAEKRVMYLRPFVDRVANNEIPLKDVGNTACDIIAEDQTILDEAAAAPAEVRRVSAELAEHRKQQAERRERIRQLEGLAALAPAIEAADADKAAAIAEIASIDGDLLDARAVEGDDFVASKKLGDDREALRVRFAAKETERRGLDAMVAKAAPLANAESRLAELRPQHDDLVKQSKALADEIAKVEPPTGYTPPEPIDLAPFRTAVEKAAQDARTAHGMIAVAEARLETAKLAAKKLAELEGGRAAAESALADWTLLADSLGRDGLQALEIDAAGPELTELINDLLRTCVGPRWTVTVETTRQSADGKKQIEGCEVRVVDTQRGREGTAESLSGGERVLVGEAVSLALSMLACRRAGVKGPTLIRDESGAALDPTNARNYVAMLRRAAELIGASKVLFVSHSPEVQELADSRLVVKDGEVTVAA